MRALLIALIVMSIVGLAGSIFLITAPKDARLGKEASAWFAAEVKKPAELWALGPKMLQTDRDKILKRAKEWGKLEVTKSREFSRVTTHGNEVRAEVTLDVELQTTSGVKQAQVLVARPQTGAWSILEWK